MKSATNVTANLQCAHEESKDQVNIPSGDVPNETIKVPDGGWGWIVTFSSFMLNCLMDGALTSGGIFFQTFLTEFGDSKGKTQLMSSMNSGMSYLIGPIAGALASRYGCRRVTILGLVLASTGFFLSTFSSSIEVMILLHGVLGGIGFGLVYTPTIIIVSTYFEKRRALAIGVATCGSGIGEFVFALLSVNLLEAYGWRGTFWIISGIVLNGVVFASFYRELKTEPVKKEVIKGSCCKKLCCSVDVNFNWSLLKSRSFVIFSLSCFLVSVGMNIPYDFLPALASDLHLSNNEGALLMSILGICNTASNVIFGIIIDLDHVNSILLGSAMLIIGGVATCLVPYYRGFTLLAAYAALFGVVIGAFDPLTSIIIVKLKGIGRLPSGFGLLNLFIGIAAIIGSPIAGTISDDRVSYDMAFYFAGAVITVAGIIILPLCKLSCCQKTGTNEESSRKE
ncbi:monocarboxylate transporter 9-like [Ylistrum balloti]|uniref:monocarboxylate transporter 9-like n=1 Tax=Ylistrum balloti TaxID=509963 RepID=UPI002905B6EC|nr:monocarboxylate transporter 9-like [Ylistrum balloti]